MLLLQFFAGRNSGVDAVTKSVHKLVHRKVVGMPIYVQYEHRIQIKN